MTSLRDTSADAFAALIEEQNAARPGASDPPLTLTGPEAHAVREALRASYDQLERLEPTIKIWRQREGVRATRISVGAAIAHFDTARQRSERGGA